MSATDPANTPVVDRRPVPRGVLPKGIQTWLMVGIAGVIVIIILFAGQPQAPQRTVQSSMPSAAASPDRVRDYQQRLNAINAQLAKPSASDASPIDPPKPALVQTGESERSAPRVDPTVAERQRHEYESLFASNVVASRRALLQRTDSRISTSNYGGSLGSPAMQEPSLDDVAEAVVRATSRVAPSVAGNTVNTMASVAPNRVVTNSPPLDPPAERQYRIVEGTIIDAVLTNRLDGGSSSPVNCLVTNSIYSQDGHRVLIPAGARVLGESHAVEGWGETRLAVSFHRIVMPDGTTSISLDHFSGLNQLGDAGLGDQVNRHYWSTFGGAAAVGLVGGLSQLLGNAAVTRGNGDRTVIMAGGSADAASQAAAQTMSQFLNRMPTITIREGHRVKVYVTRDIDVPEWNGAAASGGEE